jgi:hypothetical protein
MMMTDTFVKVKQVKTSQSEKTNQATASSEEQESLTV